MMQMGQKKRGRVDSLPEMRMTLSEADVGGRSASVVDILNLRRLLASQVKVLKEYEI